MKKQQYTNEGHLGILKKNHKSHYQIFTVVDEIQRDHCLLGQYTFTFTISFTFHILNLK